VTYSRDELFELAAAYALGATTAEETAAVEAALATSPDLAAEVASFREVVADLAQLGPDMPAPALAVRERLLSRVRREAHIAAYDVNRPPVVASRAHPWPASPRFVLLAAAASVLVVVGLGTATFGLLRRQRQLEASRVALAAHLEHRETTLNTLLHAEKDLRVIHLKAADTVKGPGIQFFWNEKHRSGVAHAFRLPPAPANHAYQLWAIVDGRATSVKVFNSDPDGHALVESLTLPATSRGATAIYVTVEPDGGSTAPTTEPFLRGFVPATY